MKKDKEKWIVVTTGGGKIYFNSKSSAIEYALNYQCFKILEPIYA